MAIRFAAASGLALAAALLVSPVARAQSFFSFYEMSPRQIVGMLQDNGYELRGPMTRRGDVYLCDVDSVSGRSMRLIVSAHDGHVLERFAGSRHRGNDDARVMRPSRDFNDDGDRRSEEARKPHGRVAYDDVLNPPSRVYGSDGLFSSKPVPPERVPDAAKSRPQAVKKHHHSNVAKAPVAAPSPDATPTTEASKTAPSSMAAVAPAAEAPKPAVLDSVKPAEAPKPVETPRSVETPKAAEAPKPAATPQAAQARVEVEKQPEAAKPKPDSARRKINDLPVGTLD